MVGPTEPQVACVDNQDGTLTVEYLPDTPGDYEIGVTFADQPVPGINCFVLSSNLNQSQTIQIVYACLGLYIVLTTAVSSICNHIYIY